MPQCRNAVTSKRWELKMYLSKRTVKYCHRKVPKVESAHYASFQLYEMHTKLADLQAHNASPSFTSMSFIGRDIRPETYIIYIF